MRTPFATTPAAGEGSPSAPAAKAPGDPLDLLLEHLKRHPRVDAAALLLVDPAGGGVELAASWFASATVGAAVRSALGRNRVHKTPEIVEAVLERGGPLFLPRVEDWEAAPRLRQELEDWTGPAVGGAAIAAWQALGRGSLLSCPVRAPLGRTLGVLLAGSLDPGRPLRHEDRETIEALADFAALAHDRSALVAAEAARAREDRMLGRAAEEAAASLEPNEVEGRIVDHALPLVGASGVVLSRAMPGGGMMPAAVAGVVDRPPDADAIGDVARTGAVRSGCSGGRAHLHVPLSLGPRLFGVLSALRSSATAFDDRDSEVLVKLARSSVPAMANAIDFERERRIARALTRGFVPQALPRVPGYDIGLLYEPADSQPAGGDLYGAWTLPGGAVALLVGDVAGKGVEAAALSAMARFFIEARSWDCDSPARALREANTMLRSRLPADTFVTAFLARLCGPELRYAAAGHLAPVVVRTGGKLEEAAGHGLPLGVEEQPALRDFELELGTGDLLLAFTDGLVEPRRDGEIFGLERLHETVRVAASAGRDAGAMVRMVHERVRAWAGALADDAVALALHRL